MVRLPAGDKALNTMLGDGWRHATGVRTAQIGKGLVCFVASDDWPGASIQDQYEECLKGLAEHAVRREMERGWFKSNQDVEFACYEQTDGSRVFYLLNVRWWDRKCSKAVFCLGKLRRSVTVPFGEIVEFSP